MPVRGFPRKSVVKLFEPFVTTKPGGTGLGLPIARRLARLQGGDLMLQWQRPGRHGRGVRLPTTATVSPPDPASR